MDSYQAPQPYMRPPPPPPPQQQPPTSDPYHYQQHQPQQQQQSGPQWYSNQYQYPPHPPQWGPPPHADRLPPPGSYPPPPNPYPAHQQPIHPQFPPPPPPSRPHVPSHLPPPPPRPPPQSYSQHTQEWGAAPSWSNNQGWDYPAHNNLEDLEAKAKAWANRQTTIENQHQQSQFPPPGRIEGQSHYHDQYPQSMDSHYSGTQHQSLSASSYPQLSVSGTPTHHPPGIHPQETSSMSSELSSYAHYAIRDGMPAGDTNAVFHHHGNLSASSSVHQQEVPSSYSSITGNEGTSAQDGKHRMQLSQPFAYGSQFADPTNLADQPLEFAPGFNSDHSPHMQSSYAYHDSHGTIRGAEPTTSVPTMNTWVTSVAPGVGYPQVHSLPSVPQHDPSMAMPSPIPGHAASSFSSFPGLSLQATIPSAGPPFALAGGTAAFPGDAYGVSPVSERPKKAAVPNWLREEIKKTVITSSSMDHPKEETQYIEGEGIDRSFGKGDQADSKSIDSSRSTEEEDDEDQVEAARTAAINQEIKRILTEVLLKVTDELFDEIATKVLAEDDLTLEGQQNTPTSNHKVLSSPPEVSGPRASAKVLISAKSKVSEREDVIEKSRSISPGNVLGLANYATDDDEDDDGDGDDDVQRSGIPNSGKDGILSQSTVKMLSNDRHDATTNNSSFVELEEHSRSKTVLASNLGKTNSLESRYNNTAAVSDISYNGHKNDETNVDRNLPKETAASRLKDTLGVLQPGLPKENVNPKKTSKDDFQGRESRMEADKLDRHESKKNSVKDFNKEVESGKIRTVEKGDGKRRGQDERHPRKERTDDRNGSKEKVKEQSVKHGEKAQESESRKRSSHADVKEDRRETERLRRASAKEDVNRKREQTKDKEDDRSRHKHSTDSSRYKRRRSSDDSSDEASDDSKRKLHSRRRNLSPSPVRSRRRQVSRSPHSKHSQRRHSPYSSLDTNRGRRSRSRSPVRRQR